MLVLLLVVEVIEDRISTMPRTNYNKYVRYVHLHSALYYICVMGIHKHRAEQHIFSEHVFVAYVSVDEHIILQ